MDQKKNEKLSPITFGPSWSGISKTGPLALDHNNLPKFITDDIITYFSRINTNSFPHSLGSFVPLFSFVLPSHLQHFAAWPCFTIFKLLNNDFVKSTRLITMHQNINAD